MYLLFGAAWVAFFGGIGYAIGSEKDRSGAGFWFGVLLGVVGWIIVGLMEPSDAERLRRNQQMAMSLRGDDATVVDTNVRVDERSGPGACQGAGTHDGVRHSHRGAVVSVVC